MKILCELEKTKKDRFRYTINQGGELGIKVSNGSDRHVTIIFVNGLFVSVEHDMNNFSERSTWHVYKGIADKISELEDQYKGGK